MGMTKEDNEHLRVLLKEKATTAYFNDYKKYYEKITGRALQSNCSKCALRNVLRVLRNYNNSI